MKMNNKIGTTRNLDFGKIPVKREDTKKSNGYEYIAYGEDNLYPQYLYEVYRKSSSKHSAIVNRKASMCAGYGFNKENISENQEIFLKNYFSSMCIDDIVRMVAYDIEVLYYFTLEIVYTNDLKGIASINYIPASKIRIGVVNMDNPYPHFLYSKDWANTRKEDNKPVYYEPYSEGLRGNKKELLYVPLFQGYTDNYPCVGYTSGLEYIEVDKQIATYHNANLDNGFNGSFMINFKSGIPTEEEMKDFTRDFKREYTKAQEAGKFIITYSDSPEETPEIVPIPTDGSADKFTELENSVLSNILIAHEVVNPELFGVKVPGELGNSDNLESLDIFQACYVDIRQKMIEDSINGLYKFTSGTKDFVPFELNKFKIKRDEE